MLIRISAYRMIGAAIAALLACVPISSFSQSEKIVYNFQGMPDGSVPSAHLIRDSSGNLYGTTAYGGANGYGSVFKIDNKGNKTTIYSFAGGKTDGATPVAALIRDSAGNLYGTTQFGGNPGYGTVFKISSTGQETILHSFNGTTDEATPVTALVRDGAGNLYGTTSAGYGTGCRCGTIFKLTAAGKFTVLHTFVGEPSDGAMPEGDMIGDSDGNLYGTTYGGGAHNYGSVYKLAKNGTFTILYSFNFGVGDDGARPESGLIRDSAGNLYGTTLYGGYFGNTCGGFGCGTVFKVDPSGNETVLYTFMGNPDGAYPKAGLVMDASGNLYGTTSKGGTVTETDDQGTIFRLSSTGAETVLHNFGIGTDGFDPIAGLTLGTGAAYYGTATQGGSGGAGIVFSIVP
jgi:uncharacterized repeat protein (TIGR03803 family)